MRTSLGSFLVVGAMVMVACSPSAPPSDSASAGASAGPPAGASDTAENGLVNTSWTVITLNGAPTLETRKPTLTFGADGSVTGNTGCNGYSGTYRADAGNISITNVSSTLVLCEGAFGRQEALFVKGIQIASTWRRNEAGQLEMLDGIGLVAAPGVAAAPPEATSGMELPGTSWELTEMAGTADLAHLVPTLIFGADGRVSGFSGCNTFNGTYFSDGRIVSLMSTKRGCPPPASTIEAEYLDALSNVTSWTVVDGKLRMDGPVPLTFAPS